MMSQNAAIIKNDKSKWQYSKWWIKMTFDKMMSQNDTRQNESQNVTLQNDMSKWQYSTWWVKMTLNKMMRQNAIIKNW